MFEIESRRPRGVSPRPFQVFPLNLLRGLLDCFCGSIDPISVHERCITRIGPSSPSKGRVSLHSHATRP